MDARKPSSADEPISAEDVQTTTAVELGVAAEQSLRKSSERSDIESVDVKTAVPAASLEGLTRTAIETRPADEPQRPLTAERVCPVHGIVAKRRPELAAFGGCPDDDEKTPTSMFESAWNAIKWTARLGYIICCPPIPSKIIQKAVFYPPKRGRYYFLIGGPPSNRQPFLTADKAFGKENLIMCLRHIVDKRYIGTIIMEQVLRLQMEIVVTPKNHYLTVAYVKCRKSITEKRQSPRIVLVSQPNSSDLGTCMLTSPNFVDIADRFSCDVIAYDYSGFGTSTGSSSEQAVYSNIETIFEFATEKLGFRPEQVILFGFSMGTAASIHMASLHHDVAGLVLLAPFTSIFRVVGRPNAERTCCFDQFCSYDKAGDVRTRTLICHGTGDRLVAKSHSEVIHKLLPNACDPFWAEDVNHQRIYMDQNTWNRVQQFFNDDLRVSEAWKEEPPMRSAGIVTSTS